MHTKSSLHNLHRLLLDIMRSIFQCLPDRGESGRTMPVLSRTVRVIWNVPSA